MKKTFLGLNSHLISHRVNLIVHEEIGDTKVEEVCQFRLDHLNEMDGYSALTKLYKQFVDPHEKRLLSLMKDAKVWKKEFRDDIERLRKEGQICEQLFKTSARPMMGLPVANKFNDRVATDLKIWKGGKRKERSYAQNDTRKQEQTFHN